MSVIVTGMEMPKNCVECNENGIRNLLDCDLILSGCANCGRHPKCPLKSVDGLIEKLKHCADRKLGIALGCNNLNERQKHIEAVNTYQHCISIIKEYCGMEDAE